MANPVEVAGNAEQGSLADRTREYVSEVRSEMSKVSWPTRQELIDSTVVVIISVLLVAAFIGVIDRVLTFLVGLLFR